MQRATPWREPFQPGRPVSRWHVRRIRDGSMAGETVGPNVWGSTLSLGPRSAASRERGEGEPPQRGEGELASRTPRNSIALEQQSDALGPLGRARCPRLRCAGVTTLARATARPVGPLLKGEGAQRGQKGLCSARPCGELGRGERDPIQAHDAQHAAATGRTARGSADRAVAMAARDAVALARVHGSGRYTVAVRVVCVAGARTAKICAQLAQHGSMVRVTA